eukprot:7034073-Prymnesium_polylepis.1
MGVVNWTTFRMRSFAEAHSLPVGRIQLHVNRIQVVKTGTWETCWLLVLQARSERGTDRGVFKTEAHGRWRRPCPQGA